MPAGPQPVRQRPAKEPGRAGDENPPSEKEFMDGLEIGHHLLPTKQVLDSEVTDVSKSDVAPHEFGNAAQQRQKVAFAAPYPGKIIPIDLRQHAGTLLCQKDAFLCAAKGIAVGIAWNKKLGAGLFGGEGFILQKLEGDGLAFCHAGGTVVSRRLEEGGIAVLVVEGQIVNVTDQDRAVPPIRVTLLDGVRSYRLAAAGVWMTLAFLLLFLAQRRKNQGARRTATSASHRTRAAPASTR